MTTVVATFAPAGIELGFAAPYRARIAVRSEDVEAARDVLADTGFRDNVT